MRLQDLYLAECPMSMAFHFLFIGAPMCPWRRLKMQFLNPGAPGVQIIQVNLTSEGSQPLKAGANLEFTYSVQWIPTDITFARRFERYLDYSFFEHQVWACS